MIHLGLDDAAKGEVVARYRAEHAIRKVYVLSPERFAPPFAPVKMDDPTTQGGGVEGVYLEWSAIIQYRYFYKLMQEVDGETLVVVNECLRTQNRHDLTYNCIRNFLQQTTHVLVFQYLPILDTWNDFAILFDFATKSRWKREAIGVDRLAEATVRGVAIPLELHPVPVAIDAATRAAYAREKAVLLAEVRSDPGKDPHLIPRNLYLVSGKAKLAHVAAGGAYLGRNQRLKIHGLATYKEASYPRTPYTVVELPHAFGDLADVLTLSRQTRLEVLVADLPADRWYLELYQAWLGRLRDAYTMLGMA